MSHWIGLAGSWTKLPFDFAYSRSHQLNWFSKDPQIAQRDYILEIPIVIFVDGNLVLNLPSSRDLEQLNS